MILNKNIVWELVEYRCQDQIKCNVLRCVWRVIRLPFRELLEIWFVLIVYFINELDQSYCIYKFVIYFFEIYV